jgi:hypothetical protein
VAVEGATVGLGNQTGSYGGLYPCDLMTFDERSL